jgi:3-phytase
MRLRFQPLLLSSLLAACATTSQRIVPPAESGDGLAATVVRGSFSTLRESGLELDSLATWVSLEGAPWVIATAKGGGLLLAFDGETGEELARIGTEAPFLGPNGVAVFGDLLFVVERDAARVAVLALPEFVRLGDFGREWLTQPYGLWLRETAPFELEVFITDSYSGQPTELERNDRRIKRFRVTLDEDIHAQLLDAFGSSGEAGALRQVESIAGDVDQGRLVIADEWRGSDVPPALRVYGFDGSYRGEDIGSGLFQGEPEGVALYDCPDGSGYWIAADQHARHNRFHLFDRRSLEWLGSFAGEEVSDSDGIALRSAASEQFPDGVLYVADAGQAVVAFDWRDIARALGLHSGCTPVTERE